MQAFVWPENLLSIQHEVVEASSVVPTMSGSMEVSSIIPTASGTMVTSSVSPSVTLITVSTRTPTAPMPATGSVKPTSSITPGHDCEISTLSRKMGSGALDPSLSFSMSDGAENPIFTIQTSVPDPTASTTSNGDATENPIFTIQTTIPDPTTSSVSDNDYSESSVLTTRISYSIKPGTRISSITSTALSGDAPETNSEVVTTTKIITVTASLSGEVLPSTLLGTFPGTSSLPSSRLVPPAVTTAASSVVTSPVATLPSFELFSPPGRSSPLPSSLTTLPSSSLVSPTGGADPLLPSVVGPPLRPVPGAPQSSLGFPSGVAKPMSLREVSLVPIVHKPIHTAHQGPAHDNTGHKHSNWKKGLAFLFPLLALVLNI